MIRRVVLPITGVHMESSVLTRDLVSHGAFKSAVVDKRHSEYKKGGLVKEEGNKQVVEPKRLQSSSAL